MMKIPIAIILMALLTIAPLAPLGYGQQQQQQSQSQQQGEDTTVDKHKTCAQDQHTPVSSLEYLTHFACGHLVTSQGEAGNNNSNTVTREFTLVISEDENLKVSHQGHSFPAWTFNGTIPGPTMRVTQGDLVHVHVVNSANNTMRHSVHFGSSHDGANDGEGVGAGAALKPGQNYTYEFTAGPYGVFPYYSHVLPVVDQVNRGLFGVLIIDPPTPRPEAIEMVMTMNGYDLDTDAEGPITLRDSDSGASSSSSASDLATRQNEIYSFNGKAFDYLINPIQILKDRPYRIYVLNMIQFDPMSSINLHGTVFNYTIAGTSMQPSFADDMASIGAGDKGIIDFQYSNNGLFMFDSMQSDMADRGMKGFFNVTDSTPRMKQVSRTIIENVTEIPPPLQIQQRNIIPSEAADEKDSGTTMEFVVDENTSNSSGGGSSSSSSTELPSTEDSSTSSTSTNSNSNSNSNSTEGTEP